jgi:hypothetical protein
MTLAGLRGEWSFLALEPGRDDVEGFDVLAADLPHKGGRTYSYRVMAAAGAWPTWSSRSVGRTGISHLLSAPGHRPQLRGKPRPATRRTARVHKCVQPDGAAKPTQRLGRQADWRRGGHAPHSRPREAVDAGPRAG